MVPTANEESRWFPTYTECSKADARLVCFPYAGGGSPVFREWGKQLSPAIQVCPVELPGRWARVREQPETDLVALAGAAAARIAALPRLPTALFGYSYGALLAYEVAHALRDRHATEVSHLFVAARPAPQAPRTPFPLHRLPEEEFRSAVQRAYSTFDAALLNNAEMASLLFKVLRADIKAVETYTYEHRTRLACPITVFGAVDDELVPVATLAGWRDQTSGESRLVEYAGGHFFLRTEWRRILDGIGAQLGIPQHLASSAATLHPTR